MAGAARRDGRMTVAEFRVWAESKPDWERWELLDGIPVLQHGVDPAEIRRLKGMPLPEAPRMSVAEFRIWVEDTPDGERWELLDGVPVLMSPTSGRHQRIVMNIGKRLDDLAERQGCSALPGLAVMSEGAEDYAPIPDVVVQCGPLPRDGYTHDPLLVVEVLSPSTMSTDRGRKTDHFRTVPSMQSFLIVYQDAKRVEVWRRDADWALRMVGDGETIELPELGGSLAVADIYARVEF